MEITLPSKCNKRKTNTQSIGVQSIVLPLNALYWIKIHIIASYTCLIIVHWFSNIYWHIFKNYKWVPFRKKPLVISYF